MRTFLALVVLTLPCAAYASKTVTADNGAVYRIESVRIVDNNWRGGGKPYVMAGVVDDENQFLYFTFTCDGNYTIQNLRGAESAWHYAPPRSVAAAISQVACAEAKKLTSGPR